MHVVGDDDFVAALLEHLEDVVSDLELLRCYEDVSDVFVVGEEIGEGAYGASACEVADIHDCAVMEAAVLLKGAMECVDVEEGLGGVLILA